MLKTNKDVAPPSHKILQVHQYGGGHKVTSHTVQTHVTEIFQRCGASYRV